jgi:hypothetical protein
MEVRDVEMLNRCIQGGQRWSGYIEWNAQTGAGIDVREMRYILDRYRQGPEMKKRWRDGGWREMQTGGTRWLSRG